MANKPVVEFFVHGTPRPGGSKTAFPTKYGKIAMVDASGRRGKEWRTDVKEAARVAYQGEPLEGPLSLSIMFWMPRPKAHYGKGGLREDAPYWHTNRPDITKLVRSVEDALTGILWKDDAQIVSQFADKKYADHGHGAEICVCTDPICAEL